MIRAKRCPRCQVLKDLDDFHRNRTKADGRHSWCRACRAALGGQPDARYDPSRVQSGRLCECGCGGETFIAVRTDSRYSQRRGEPLRFLPGHPGFQPTPIADTAVLSRVLAAIGHHGRRAA